MASKSCGLCCAPMFLRLALGVVFVWAGLVKVGGSMPVKGDDAAALANMGVISPPSKATSPATKPPKSTGSSGAAGPTSPPETAPKSHTQRPISGESGMTASAGNSIPVIVLTAAPRPTAKTYTAEDFPDEVQVKPVYGIALMLKKAAATTDADGKPIRAIWPAMLAHEHWPVYMAWACALTELVGGAFVLLGFLTRLSALALAFNMGTAIWLTQVGPAIASGHTKLGFLPDHDWSDGMAWMNFNYQFVLLMVCLTMVGIGAGRMAVDRVLFPPPTPLTPPRAKPENAPDA